MDGLWASLPLFEEGEEDEDDPFQFSVALMPFWTLHSACLWHRLKVLSSFRPALHTCLHTLNAA